MLLVAVCALTAMSSDIVVAATKPCKAEGRECVLLTVPLDRSGAVPGTVRLRIERKRATRPRRPPLLVLSGLPGESSLTAVYDGIDHLLRQESRARDIVSLDLRGTGRSGALRCPKLERTDSSGITQAAAKCAASLGPRRGFFGARESAEDIEAVRQALGIERMALLGGSYGAQVAFAYAQHYPSRVDRLALDSIPGPHGFDSLYRPGLAAVPDAVQVLCRKNRCQHASKDPLGDLTALARRLERGPLTGSVIGDAGRPRKASIEAFELFQLLRLAVDGERGIVGLVHNARRGDLRPLLRLVAPWPRTGGLHLPARFTSPAAFAASMCEESLLPWSRTAPIAERRRQATAFVDGLRSDSLLPFGPRAALGSDILDLCREWPIASVAPEPPKVLPAIPTLIVTSVDDVLAPVSSARAVANLIPGSRLLRLRGAGHGVFSDGGGSSCAQQVLQKFLAGTMPEDVCGPEWKSYRGASKPPPLSLAELAPDPRVRGRAGRALRAVNATIRDGAEIVHARFMGRIYELRFRGRRYARRNWREILLPPVRTGGLRNGTYALKPFNWRMTLRGASYVPGVRLDGWMVLAQDRVKRRGVIRISGPGAPRGRLVIRRGMMSGRLEGRQVEAPMRLGPDLGFVVQRTPGD